MEGDEGLSGEGCSGRGRSGGAGVCEAEERLEDWRVGEVGSEVVGEVTVLGDVKACLGGLADIDLHRYA